MDARRLEYHSAEIDEYHNNFEALPDDLPAALFVNVD
jgi:hypothetical protein